jgi:hypothetical protein
MAIPRGLVLALDLIRAPVLADTMRRQPLLPSGEILILLRIAGGCPETSRRAAEAAGQPPEIIRDAVILYLKQVLLFPDADSYRVLGVAHDAPQRTIREHLHWLMRWLHPDRNRNSWETVFTFRVLSAWEDLKSPRKRQEYDRRRRQHNVLMSPGPQMRQGTTRRVGIPWIATPLARKRPLGRVWIPVLVFAALVGLAAWLTLPQMTLPGLPADEAGAHVEPVGEPIVWEAAAEPNETHPGGPEN